MPAFGWSRFREIGAGKCMLSCRLNAQTVSAEELISSDSFRCNIDSLDRDMNVTADCGSNRTGPGEG